jgi:hypothetical protein
MLSYADLDVLLLDFFDLFAHSNHSTLSHAFMLHHFTVIRAKDAADSVARIFLDLVQELKSLLVAR